MMMPQGKPLSAAKTNAIAGWILMAFGVAIVHLPLLLAELVWIKYLASDQSRRGPILNIIGMDEYAFLYLLVFITAIVYMIPLKQGWLSAIANTGRTYSKSRYKLTVATSIMLWYAVVWTVLYVAIFGLLSLH